MTSNREVAYSTDGEYYQYRGVGEVIDALGCDDLLEEGTVYYESDMEPVDFADYLRAGHVLEEAAEWAGEDMGDEAYEVFNGVGNEAGEALQELLTSWVRNHLTGADGWFKCVGVRKTHTVTAEDILEFNGENVA